MEDKIIIKGAKMHNLKNISLSIFAPLIIILSSIFFRDAKKYGR